MIPSDAPRWAHDLIREIRADQARPRSVPTYAVATLPKAVPAGQIVFVVDEAGGAVLAFSDGTNWRRVTDRAICS